MSKNSYPKTNLAANIDDLLSSKPRSEVETVKTESPTKREPLKQSESDKTVLPPHKINAGEKITKKKVIDVNEKETDKKKKEYVMTYFSDENYDQFEDMYNEIKRHVRQETGIKLKETHIAEIAIMMTVGLYRSNKKAIFDQIVEMVKK